MLSHPLLKRAASIRMLSKATVEWLRMMLNKTNVPSPSTAIAAELTDYRSPSAYPELYRVMGFGAHKAPEANYTVGTNVALSFELPTCWTVSQELARRYATGTHSHWVIVKLTNFPNGQVIADTRILPSDIRAKVMEKDMREVILKPGTLNASVVEIGAGNKGGMQSVVEWHRQGAAKNPEDARLRSVTPQFGYHWTTDIEGIAKKGLIPKKTTLHNANDARGVYFLDEPTIKAPNFGLRVIDGEDVENYEMSYDYQLKVQIPAGCAAYDDLEWRKGAPKGSIGFGPNDDIGPETAFYIKQRVPPQNIKVYDHKTKRELTLAECQAEERIRDEKALVDFNADVLRLREEYDLQAYARDGEEAILWFPEKIPQYKEQLKKKRSASSKVALSEDARENLNKFLEYGGTWNLSQEDYAELHADYPFKGGVLYRGLNFKTEDDFKIFWAESKEGTAYKDTGYSSWTPDKSTAYPFAITWPTYHFNRELAQAEDAKTRSGDYMIGYRGIVIKTTVGANVGIDVNATGIARESEVLLPAGTYKTEVVKLYEPFRTSINESNYETELQTIDSLGDRDSFDTKKFYYILKNFTKFSEQAQAHLEKVLRLPAKPQAWVKYEPPSKYDWDRNPKGRLQIWDNLPFNILVYYGLFRPAYQEQIRKFVNGVVKARIRELSKVLQTNQINMSTTRVDNQGTWELEKQYGDPKLLDQFRQLVNAPVGKEYRNLEQTVREINQIKDPNQMAQAIDDYAKTITQLLQNVVASKVANLEPNPSNPNQVKNPLPEPTPEEDRAFEIAGYRWVRMMEQQGKDADEMMDSGEGLPLEDVDPRQCVSNQPWVHKDFAQNRQGTLYPVISELNGKYLVDDGNHRAASALINNEMLKAYVIHLPRVQ